jgi:hypothetical protein
MIGFDLGDKRRLLTRLYSRIRPVYGGPVDYAALTDYRRALANIRGQRFGRVCLYSLYLGAFEWDLWVY